MQRYDGTEVVTAEYLSVPAQGVVNFNLCQHDRLDTYGVITFQLDTANTLIGSIIRIGNQGDYRFPTPVRQ